MAKTDKQLKQQIQKEEKKDNSIGAWLERILDKTKTGNIIGAISVLITLIIGIPSICVIFSDRPAQITVEYISSWLGKTDYCKPVDKKITQFVSVQKPTGKNIYIGDKDHISFHNKCNKSVTNLRVSVEVVYGDLHLNLADINPDYEILHCDSVYDIMRSITLRYKNDILHAQGVLPLPITTLSLQDEATDEAKLVAFYYNILYDGLKTPLLIKDDHLAYFSNGLEEDEPVLSRYLDDCYYHYRYFTDNRATTLVTIPTNREVIFVTPPTLSSDEDYEKFKKSFIEDLGNGAGL